MAKKKPLKKPAKSAGKSASPLKKALKKAVKALTGSKSRVPHKAAAKKPGKKTSKPHRKEIVKKVTGKSLAVKGALVAKKGPLAKKEPSPPKTVAAVKAGKSARVKAGPVVEVVIPPSHPLLKSAKKEHAAALPGKKRCREPGCDHDALMAGYCRLHYIKNWRRIKRKEAILASGQLNNYVEELVSKYPDKYLEVIRQDLASEKDWAKVVIDLELEVPEEEGAAEEEAETVSDGVRRDRDFNEDDTEF